MFARNSWRLWPLIAALVALGFISWDMMLMSRARSVQERISGQVELLNDLDALGMDLRQLALVHQVDLNTDGRWWEQEVRQLKRDHDHILETHANEPGIGDLRRVLEARFQQIDSLHQGSLSGVPERDQNKARAAVLKIILQRAEKAVENTARLVHERGLRTQTAALSDHWDHAQVLLVMACLLAVVFAWLVGTNRKLLSESRGHGTLLADAKQKLEQTNRELRETMLSKEEKEVMIKEIHHSVKNNLQIVKSLVRFQMDQVEDPNVRELFNECITRVGAMALVHEQTYLSKDLANIDVRTYLDQLVRDLTHVYSIDTRLQLDVDIRTHTLGVDTLVPLGLLINEVISNALKYAFRGRDEGRISVFLDGNEEGGLHLRIGDNGVGLPGRDKWDRPNSLGMELIHTLAGQLDGSIELLPGNGTVYELVSDPGRHRRVA